MLIFYTFRYTFKDKCPGDDIVRLLSVSVIADNYKNQYSFDTSDKIGIQMTYEVLKSGHILWLGHNIINSEGINVFDTHSVTLDTYHKPHEKGVFTSVAWIPGNILNEDTYFISCAIFNHNRHIIHFHEQNIISFSTQINKQKVNAKGQSLGRFPGVVMPLLKWEVKNG